ncbi:winged helix-turn-helix domain-containing protein [Lunatimonas salinarum]|uniref:winged helix-turn-helix domain-containing protein n=1 Tax=Lunatimonas salinarum TaxID=1774590 RepID=UPI001AE0529E|nr:winged helix-turn-helix domain-containing protein [Lunatimonas salinarum]
MLDSLITSKTRIKLLVKFFSSEGNVGYLRGLAEEFQESTNSVRVELNRLSEAGLLTSGENGKTKLYRANETHPFYHELRNMVSKFLGLDQLVEQIVLRMGPVEKAYVVGDYARGIDSGTIEMILVGRELDLEYLDFLANKTYDKIQRKVSVTVTEQDPEEVEGFLVYGV